MGNHPFVDGNKRVGLASALVFLDLNGIVVRTNTEELYELTMRVARGALKKREVVEVLGEIVGRE
ncbi:type II toxin-antitoxin system death-on-curing family toxin [Lujinxingia vulgaris]|uniref:type II toxin-antitoxin system death-on-curing family toxin n=1 Tax=Lujinxingia vulgaris TaxID=2600176 RepID=UPI001E472572